MLGNAFRVSSGSVDIINSYVPMIVVDLKKFGASNYHFYLETYVYLRRCSKTCLQVVLAFVS